MPLHGVKVKRNKTFTGNNHTNRHRNQRGAGGNGGGRYGTVPRIIDSSSKQEVITCSPPPCNITTTSQQQKKDPAEPLHIRTSMDSIFEEAFVRGKRKSLNADQIDQLTAALALPEKCLRQQRRGGGNSRNQQQDQKQQQQTSPTGSSSSSGFGSADDHLSSSYYSSPTTSLSSSSSPASPIVEFDRSSSSKQVPWFHFWFVVWIQYLLNRLGEISTKAKKHRLEYKNADPRAETNSSPDQMMAPSSMTFLKKLSPVRSRRKPAFYSELHLGRLNQHSTTLDAVEADRLIYPTRKYIDHAEETTYVTSVFEIRQRGIEELTDSLNEEILRYHLHSSEGFDDGELLIVCCELQWSTPDRYRNIAGETKMKQDVMRYLRVNNGRVLNQVARRNERLANKANDGKKFDQFLLLPDSVTEESVGRNRNGAIGCFGGSYRRYYAGLVPCAHRQTADEHQPWWEFKKHTMPESITWPVIAPIDKTSVLMLNLICLKLNKL